MGSNPAHSSIIFSLWPAGSGRSGAITVLSPGWVVLLLVFSLLGGCNSFQLRARSVDYDPSLLSGERVFGEEVSISEVPDANLVEVSEEMAAYMETNVGARRLSVARFKRLFYALSRDGYFSSTYAAEKTYNAQDTFDLKAGNCLSYTNLFVALSRYAGLDARFQVVDVPPSWDADSGYLIRYTHINVLMKGVKLEDAGGADFAVDFNSVHPDPEYPTRLVSDLYAESLFHANRSVDRVRNGEMRAGFAHLRRSIELVPYNPDLWINLGALYAKADAFDAAIESYEVALDIDPTNKGAISGLSRAYFNKGDLEKADYYAEQVRKYRENNPYYHFALAQSRYEREEYAEALQAINTAIDLTGRNGRFYFMKGLTEQKLGDSSAARKSFQQAERFGQFKDLKLRYVNELAGVSMTAFDQF